MSRYAEDAYIVPVLSAASEAVMLIFFSATLSKYAANLYTKSNLAAASLCKSSHAWLLYSSNKQGRREGPSQQDQNKQQIGSQGEKRMKIKG